ncbi:hypothetical protein FRB95_013183 [Tulasnella sp. JGI-2019a]|nr:hypothetical protein FRB95_013183 [Tulasnella sp. JGI-2019a]
MDLLSNSAYEASTGVGITKGRHRKGIGELPIELLINIFGWSSGLCRRYYMETRLGRRPIVSYISRLQIMAQVCRRWREIINGAPELWTFVTDQDKASTAIVLDRSREHPIGIWLREDPIGESLYVAVLAQSHRWILADIEVHRDDQEALRRLEEVDAPMLKCLVLEVSALDRHSIFVLDLLRDHPPQLTSLTLVEVAMRFWNSRLRSSSPQTKARTHSYIRSYS